MRRVFGLGIVALLLLNLAVMNTAAAAVDRCDRQCLYGHLDQYLAALKVRDPARASWAQTVHYTENNVALKIGDGVWGTTLDLGVYNFRFADVRTGNVAFYGVLKEAQAESPFALRLNVVHGKIAEAEMLIARSSEAGVPFVRIPDPVDPQLMAPLAPAEHASRETLIAVANGYFNTFQNNNGTLHTAFTDTCNRVEDGMQTTNNPDVPYAPFMALGCAEQMRLGYFRYVDRLRSRRFLVVDEELGLVMAGAFFDISGRLEEYTLTDGQKVPALFRRPVSDCMLETFKIRGGKIAHVEAIFTNVPYRMPSPWVAAGFHYE